MIALAPVVLPRGAGAPVGPPNFEGRDKASTPPLGMPPSPAAPPAAEPRGQGNAAIPSAGIPTPPAGNAADGEPRA